MNTQTIIAEINNEFEIEDSLFKNYFAEAIEDANNDSIDSAIETFDLVDVEFYEGGVTGIEDEDLSEKVNTYYFNSFESSLIAKAKEIVQELNSKNNY